jgi:hypothetical protein
MIRFVLAAALATGTAFAAEQSATQDSKALANEEQQKPAVQPQMPIPGPTPQETSREGRQEERMNQGSGSSAPTPQQGGASGSSEKPAEEKKN